MEPPNTAPHGLAVRLRLGLALLAVAIALATAWSLLRELRTGFTALTAWPRHAAVVESLADEQWVELEITPAAHDAMPSLRQPQHPSPTRESHVRVLLPRPSYLWAGLRDEVDLAHDPQDPARVVLLDAGSLGVPLLAKGVLIALLGVAWRGWRRLPWGSDRLWQRGAWVDTARTAQRPGAAAAPADELREPAAVRRATRFWAVVMGMLTVALAIGGVLSWHDEPVGVAATWLVIGALDLLLVHTFVAVRTRVLRWDREGLADSDLFQTRRISWPSMGRLVRLNIAAEEQQRFERLSHAARRGRMRPRSDFRWLLHDTEGRELLRLHDGVQAQPAFAALVARIGPQAAAELQLAREVAGAAVPAAHGARVDNAAGAPSDRRLEALQRGHDDAMRWGVVIVIAPFVAAAVFSTARATWFVVAAERAAGTVVAKSEESPTSLTVAYTPRGAAGPLQIESDGTEGYGAVPIGAAITVYYDPERPSHARLDLFLELWLWPMILGGLALLVAVPFGLALRSMSRR